MPGETGAGSTAGSNVPAGLAGNAGSTTETEIAAKPGTESAKPAIEDPDFEWDEPGADEKAPPVKKKMKLSEAQKRFATFEKDRTTVAEEKRSLQKYREEHLSPLEKTIKELRDDPTKLIELSRRLGVDPRKAMEQLAKEELKLLEMTPEQRRVYELEQEIARRDTAEQERAAKQQQQQQQEQNTKIQTNIANSMVKAVDAAKLPKHPMVLTLMSAFLRAQVNNEQEPDNAAAAESVREFASNYTKTALTNLTYDELVDTFPDVVRKIREGDSGKVAIPHSQRPTRPPPKTQVKRPLTTAEFTAKMMRGE